MVFHVHRRCAARPYLQIINTFFPTTLCGVLVFDSVSRRLLLRRRLLPPPPPTLNTHFVNTHFVQHTLSTQTLSTHTLSTHTLSTHTLSTHTLSTHTLSTHTLSTHTLFTYTSSTYTLSTHTLFTYTSSTHTLSTHTLSTHTLFTYTLSTHTLSTYTLSTHTLCSHTLCQHTLCQHTLCSHTLCPHTLCQHTLCQHTLHTSHTDTFTHTQTHTHTHSLAQTHVHRRFVAGVAHTRIHRRFTWQAWHNFTSTFVLRGRRGTDGTGWRAWSGLVARDAAALCVAGVAQPHIHRRFTWQAWHNLTSTVVLRGRRGTYGTGWRAWSGLVARDAAALCVAGVAQHHIHLRFTWQAWHNLTSSVALRGRHGTYGTGWRAWSGLVARDAAALCVAGVAQLHIQRRFAWQPWDRWHWVARLVRLGRPGRRGTLRGRRGTTSHPPSFHVAGVAQPHIQRRFAWQPWDRWHWVARLVRLGRPGRRGTLRGRRGTTSHPPSFHVAGVAQPHIQRRFAWQPWDRWHWVARTWHTHTHIHTHTDTHTHTYTHAHTHRHTYTHTHTHTRTHHPNASRGPSVFVMVCAVRLRTHNQWSRIDCPSPHFLAWGIFDRGRTPHTHTRTHTHTHTRTPTHLTHKHNSSINNLLTHTRPHITSSTPILHHLFSLSCLSHAVFAFLLLLVGRSWLVGLSGPLISVFSVQSPVLICFVSVSLNHYVSFTSLPCSNQKPAMVCGPSASSTPVFRTSFTSSQNTCAMAKTWSVLYGHASQKGIQRQIVYIYIHIYIYKYIMYVLYSMN